MDGPANLGTANFSSAKPFTADQSKFDYFQPGTNRTQASSSITTNAGNASYGNVIAGKLDLAAAITTIAIAQTGTLFTSASTLTTNADATASGLLAKNSAGQVQFSGNNDVSSDLVINSGTFGVLPAHPPPRMTRM